VKKLFIALSAVMVWTAIPAVSAHAVSVGQSCAKTTLGTRVSARINKKPVIVVCRRKAGRKQWIRAAVQTITTTTTSTSTTSTTSTTTTTTPVAAAFTDVASQTEPTLRTFTVTGKEPRTYNLNVSANYSKETPAPLILAFHSRTTNAKELLRSTSILEFVNDMGFVLATINGAVHEFSSWNAGTCCTPATDFKEDDVELSSLIIDSLSSTYSIDPNRIWAIGHSNGGMMAYRLACDLSDKISGVAIVGGALMDDSCTPEKPVSIMHIHGDLDETIPFTGGGKFDVPDIQTSVIKPNANFSCDIAPNEVTPIVGVNQVAWNCEQGAQTKLMNFLDNGHEWHLEYTKAILRFLFAHPRK
jgi:polyhydroxybutyrate depolymerase